MKTIEKFADDYSKSAMTDYEAEVEINGECNIEQLIKNAVINSVEFAQRWIPVDEEKPEIDESVLMKNSFGCYGVGKWDGKDWTFYTIEGVAKLSNWISKECTHWRPIELK